MDLPIISHNQTWCCSNGCGDCEVRQKPFEYSRTETAGGDLIESKTEMVWVSSCCEADLILWDRDKDDFVDWQLLPSASRDDRQKQVRHWCAAAFGQAVAENKEERADRFIEEAAELVQAAGMSLERVIEVVKYVYSRPAGELGQEVGGVSVTLLALCEAHGISADGLERAEIERILTKGPDHFRARQNAKAAQGVAMEAVDA